MEEIIRSFLICSINRDFTGFDFSEAFDVFEYHLDQKLIEHGLCSFDKFTEYYAGLSSDMGWQVGCFATDTPYLVIDESEVLDSIAMLTYIKYREAFLNLESFQLLLRLKRKLENRAGFSELKNILLFDECIHAEHESGTILDCDISTIKENLDKIYTDKVLA